MSENFVILHLSDLHIGKPGTDLDSLNVLEPLLKDLEHMHKTENLTPQLVVITGDIAYGKHEKSSLKEQYKKAENFLEKVCAKVGSSIEALPILLVPGNHDIDRSLISSAYKKDRDDLDEAKVERMMLSPEKLEWQDYIRRQKDWFNFLKKITDRQEKWNIDENFLTAHRIIEHNKKKIGVVGLNSSWASHEENEQGKIWIGKHQYDVASKFINGNKVDFRIVASHHSIDWVHKEEKAFLKQKITTQFNLFFHGHEHDQWFVDTDGHLKVEAGPCYEKASRTNNYCWIKMDFKNKKGQLFLRTYNNAGIGGWCQHVIPGKTDKNGIAEVEHFFKDSENKKVVKSFPGSKPKKPKKQDLPKTLAQYIEMLESDFKFRWERHNFGEPNAKVRVYWPVKLRHPTPIHAAQCFAAAGLQRYGCKIFLCIDNLGNTTYNINDFETKIRSLFKLAGGDGNFLEILNFKNVFIQSANHNWKMVENWLGTLHYKTDEVLVISKIAKRIEFDQETIEGIKRYRPRRLLTPAMVWACLLEVHMKDKTSPIITLGGYDERSLWEAWHVCNTESSITKIGHLYVSELKHVERSSTSAVYMGDTPLEWKSKIDIENEFRKDINNQTEKIIGQDTGRMIPWCLNNCVLLPGRIKNSEFSISIKGKTYSNIREMEELNPEECMDDIVSEVNKWLLA